MLLALTATAFATYVEDFEGDNLSTFYPGDIINQIVPGNGYTIDVVAKGCSKKAMIFDAAAPTGGDADLSIPAKGNILIVSQDGNSTNPNDCGSANVLKFKFAPKAAYVSRVGLLDIEEGARIVVFPTTGASYPIDVPPTLDNEYVSVPIHDTVTKINVKFFGSGAVTEIEYDDPCTYQSSLRFTEMNIDSSDYIDIKNTGPCPLDMGGLNILFDDSSSPDLDFVIPAGTTIAPGQTLRFAESPGPGEVDTMGNIYFSDSRGGAALLCTGVCASAADVIDVVAFSDGEPHPPLPLGVTFLPGGLSGSELYTRVAFNGVSPAFKLADWA